VRHNGAADPNLPKRPVGIPHEEPGDDRLLVAMRRAPLVEARGLGETLDGDSCRGARVADEVDRRLLVLATAEAKQLEADAVVHRPHTILARLFELVIFDCDGVLVDSEPIANRVLAEAITEAGWPITTEECMGIFMGRRWEDSLAMIETRLGHPLPPEFSRDFRARRDAALDAELEPVPGIAEAIDRIPLLRCVASSSGPEKIRVTLAHTGLLDRFEGRIFSAHVVERGKPAPDLFLHAAAEMGVAPPRCAVVEDTIIGIEAARAAGMSVFGFCAHFASTAMADAGATPFDSMAKLPELLVESR
jgi:HAD superfamily hydrolase (TIGR01509 family)